MRRVGWAAVVTVIVVACGERPAAQDLQRHEAALSSVAVVAEADGATNSADPARNFGSDPRLWVDQNPEEELFLRFRVTGVGAPIARAVLRLYVTNGSSGGPSLYRVDPAWSESTLTWNSRPARVGSPLVSASSPQSGAFLELDVTSQVTGEGVFSFSLVPTSTDGADFSSREAPDPAHRPTLVISTGAPAPAEPTQELRLRPVADATVIEAAPGANFGGRDSLVADLSPRELSLLRFDLTGVEGELTGARLRLHVLNGSWDGPALHAVTGGWEETSVTWSNRPSVAATPVADLGAVSTGSWIELDLLSLMTGGEMVDVALVATSGDGTDVASREATEALRPELILTVSGDSAPPPPEPEEPLETVVLMPVADASIFEASPAANAAGSERLQTDASPRERAFLRFEVPGQQGAIASAKIRLHIVNGSAVAPLLHLADPSWSEETLTWSNQPPIAATSFGTAGPAQPGTWLEFDVSSHLQRSGRYDFALVSTASDGTDVASSEHADPALRPQLVLTVVEDVRVVGRTRELSGGLQFSFAGTEASARFWGTSASVTFDHRPGGGTRRSEYSVYVDDTAPAVLRLEEGLHSYVIAAGLPEGAHTVRIVKRTEPFVGDELFRGFQFGPEGDPLPPPAPNPRRLLVIGDSITTGYGVLGDGPECSFVASEQDFTSAWAALTARSLDAEVVAVALAGYGLYRNYDGTTEETMRHIFERSHPWAPEPWDHGRFEPQAVLVALGTNDFAGSVPDRDGFTGALRALLRRVQEVHPSAAVFVTLSPMLSDSYPREQRQRTVADDYLRSVVDELNAGGAAPPITYFPFAEQLDSDGLGCEWHPGIVTQQKLADEATEALRRVLGW